LAVQLAGASRRAGLARLGISKGTDPSAYNRSAIVTVFDYTSHSVWLADCPDYNDASTTLAALYEIAERIPEHLRCSSHFSTL
jgi:hypothetical protein